MHTLFAPGPATVCNGLERPGATNSRHKKPTTFYRGRLRLAILCAIFGLWVRFPPGSPSFISTLRPSGSETVIKFWSPAMRSYPSNGCSIRESSDLAMTIVAIAQRSYFTTIEDWLCSGFGLPLTFPWMLSAADKETNDLPGPTFSQLAGWRDGRPVLMCGKAEAPTRHHWTD